MTQTLTGNCICGAVAYEVEDNFASFKLCHCDFCKKASGASNVANAFGNPAALSWRQGVDNLSTFDVPNSLVRRVFCKTCGTSLPFISQNGAYLIVPVGTLAQQPSIRPQEVVFWKKRMSWYDEAACLRPLAP